LEDNLGGIWLFEGNGEGCFREVCSSNFGVLLASRPRQYR